MNDAVRRKELGDFLRTRRTRMSPEDSGIAPGTRRRTPGLRREEVANLAGISVTWYTWLEQGRPIQVSPMVLDGISSMLKLEPFEREHLFALAGRPFPKLQAGDEVVSDNLRTMLPCLEPNPAYVRGKRWDILAWNRACSLLLGDFAAMPLENRNTIWRLFVDEDLKRRIVNWTDVAHNALAYFRLNYDRYAGDPLMEDLISRLRENSEEFRRWWVHHDVRQRNETIKDIDHPVVGRMLFRTGTFQVNSTEDLQFVLFTPCPDYDTKAKMERLLSGNV